MWSFKEWSLLAVYTFCCVSIGLYAMMYAARWGVVEVVAPCPKPVPQPDKSPSVWGLLLFALGELALGFALGVMYWSERPRFTEADIRDGLREWYKKYTQEEHELAIRWDVPIAKLHTVLPALTPEFKKRPTVNANEFATLVAHVTTRAEQEKTLKFKREALIERQPPANMADADATMRINVL